MKNTGMWVVLGIIAVLLLMGGCGYNKLVQADEKVTMVMLGLASQIPITTLCKLNNVSPSQFYEWREQFIARGKEGLMGNGGRSKREMDLEKKLHVLERCIGELTLEKELLKKISFED